MPTISTETIYFMREEFKRVIRVLADGQFHIKLPDAVTEANDIREVQADTKEGALSEWNRLCKAHEEMQTTSRKVIMYDFNEDNHFAHGLAVEVAAQVMIEYEMTQPSGEIAYRYGKVDSKEDLPWCIRDTGHLCPRAGDRMTEKILDWTPARHAFFTNLANALKGLKDKLLDLGNDEEKLLNMADNGIKLIGNEKKT